jgi:protein-disulfide isomerase
VVQAGELGINGTPAVFVNGKFFNGAVPYDQIKSTIDAELDQ